MCLAARLTCVSAGLIEPAALFGGWRVAMVADPAADAFVFGRLELAGLNRAAFPLFRVGAAYELTLRPLTAARLPARPALPAPAA